MYSLGLSTIMKLGNIEGAKVVPPTDISQPPYRPENKKVLYFIAIGSIGFLLMLGSFIMTDSPQSRLTANEIKDFTTIFHIGILLFSLAMIGTITVILFRTGILEK